MIRSVVLGITERSATKRILTGTPLGRRVAERFVAGESLDSAVGVAQRLNADGLKVSLDHLGEHVSTIDEARVARDAYLECTSAIARAELDANISVKLTQLGLGLDDGVALDNISAIAESALAVGTTVTIDMEESEHTQATIDIYEAVQRGYGNLGVAIQSYLKRSASDLDRLIPLGGHIRLCKGAYAEPGDIAYQAQGDVDDAFDRLAALLMSSPDTRPAIASHDDNRIELVLDEARHRKGPWEIQMLHGVRRDRQNELVALGYDVRVYVPFGAAWYPYLTRRLAERPANLTFFARALLGR
ncbi:MAG: proline dehydrogenase [Proteobacteria bacterium]|nr:proline dehydrogenase [Pseudomonadota bacterium]